MTASMKTPALLPAGRTNRSRLSFYAIGAVHRSSTVDLPLDKTTWSVEGATHVVRANNAGDAVRAYLSDEVTGPAIETWSDDERGQRLLFVCPVEELPFLSSWLRDGRTAEYVIETSTTHRRRNLAPIRFLRVR